MRTLFYLGNLSVLLEDGAKGLVGRLPRQATHENLLVHLQIVARQPVPTLDYSHIWDAGEFSTNNVGKLRSYTNHCMT